MNDELTILLKAKNSSGEQTLYLNSQDDYGEDEFWFTLTGEYKENHPQDVSGGKAPSKRAGQGS